jgi:hypothetical protein
MSSEAVQAASDVEKVPPCAASMGCLCAGHARGDDADAPCNTSEGTPRPPIDWRDYSTSDVMRMAAHELTGWPLLAHELRKRAAREDYDNFSPSQRVVMYAAWRQGGRLTLYGTWPDGVTPSAVRALIDRQVLKRKRENGKRGPLYVTLTDVGRELVARWDRWGLR